MTRAKLDATRYARDKNPGAYAVSVTCLKCGSHRRLADMLIDRQGVAFQAYYCADTCDPRTESN